MAHGHNTVIKDEIECNNKRQNFPVNTGCYIVQLHHQNSTQQRPTAAKMGSRRIFTPQFKLQVLESYRNDNDCKGNQRATARKYGIHRRQIQKWLQVEDNLKAVVSNTPNSKNILLSNNNSNSLNHNLALDVKLPSLSSTTLSSTARHRVVVQNINKTSNHSPSYNYNHHTQHSGVHSMATTKMLSQMSSPTHVGAFISPIHSYVCDRSVVSFEPQPSYGDYEMPSSVSLPSSNSKIVEHIFNNTSANDRRGFSSSPSSSFTPYHSSNSNCNSVVTNGLEPTIIQIPPIAIPTLCVPSLSSFAEYAYFRQPYPPNTTISIDAAATPLITGSTGNIGDSTDLNQICELNNNATVATTYTPDTTAPTATSASNNDDQHRGQQLSPIDLSISHAQRKIVKSVIESKTLLPHDTKWVNIDQEFDDETNNSEKVDKTNNICGNSDKIIPGWKYYDESSSNTHIHQPYNAVDLTCSKRKRLDSTDADDDEAISCSPSPKVIKLFKPYLLDDSNEQKTTRHSNDMTKNLNENGSSNRRNASAAADPMQIIKKNSNDELQQQQDAIIWNNHHHHITTSYVYSDNYRRNFSPQYSSAVTSYPASPTYSSTTYWSQASPVSGYDSSSSIYSDTEPTPDFCDALKYEHVEQRQVEHWLKQEHDIRTNIKGFGF